MNERIKELWVQGTQTVVPREGDYSSVSARNIEKFAELIIRDCVKMCYETTGNSYLNGVAAGTKIMLHFGFEEMPVRWSGARDRNGGI